MLKIYNSLLKSKEIFKPFVQGHVNLYVCGMTVYDLCHIGHARSMIVFDVVVRFLKSQGYQVKYVRNITDIDDKIIRRANEKKENFKDLTDRNISAMHEDMIRLGLIAADEEPRATEFMEDIIRLIQTLVDKGAAYVGDNGDVYFDISHFENYGKLSHRDLDKLRVGARVKLSKAKADPLDFVLWKLAKPDEPSWDSPWGEGRPGWHIECSAMALSCLNNQVDIHGGGMDLLFPHHENELAQSEAATGERFVNTWMHVGLLQINKTKMSKSLGNIFTIREVLEKFLPEVVRYFMISSHYRSPLNYSEKALQQAHQSLGRLYVTLRDHLAQDDVMPPKATAPKTIEFEQRFIAKMNDDFNTPCALSVLFDLSHEINRLDKVDNVCSGELVVLLKYLGGLLGILQQNPDEFLKSKRESQFSDDELLKIESLIQERLQVRKDKNWAEADRIREELSSMNVILEDTSDGTNWRSDDGR